MMQDTKYSSRLVFTGRKAILPTLIISLFLIFAGQFFQPPMQAMAAQKAANLSQVEQIFEQSIKDGKQSITFTAPSSFTTPQIQTALKNAAKSQSKLVAGSVQFTKKTSGATAEYKIVFSKDALMKVKVLKSEKAAVKAAAKALKTGKYSTNFYSSTSYYDVFRQILQEHPEYNYDTAVWRNTNGAYGYQRSTSLTKAQQDKKMKAADKAAQEAVKKCVTSGMSDKQKAKAIHNYIIKKCKYFKTQDAFTAYGALVDGNAVCQGYTAAFNLMALKSNLQSMAVCGTAQGGPHAWNYVKLGNQFAYIDCTWDDTGDFGSGVIYTYFNASEDLLQKQHKWNKAQFPASDIKYCKYFKAG